MKEIAGDADYLVVISRSKTDILQMSADRLFNRDTKETKYDFDRWHDAELEKIEEDKSLTPAEKKTAIFVLNSEYKKKMSTLKGGWDSCKNIEGGCNAHFNPTEIENGALVAYVIEPTDKNIKHPLSRILLVPLMNKNDEDDIVLYASQVYGDYVKGFEELVEEWLQEHQGVVDYTDYEAHDDKVYTGDISGYVEIKLDRERIFELFEKDFWHVNRESEECYSTDMSDLDQIFGLNRRNWSLQNLWNYYNDSNYESYKYEDNLHYIMEELFTQDENLLEDFLKYIKYERPEDFDLEDFIKELPEINEELSEDLANWYGEKKEEYEIQSLKEEIKEFFIQNSDCIRLDYNSPEITYYLRDDERNIGRDYILTSDSALQGLHDYFENFRGRYSSVYERISMEALDNTEPVSTEDLERHINTIIY